MNPRHPEKINNPISPIKKKQGEVFASHIEYQSTGWKWKLQQEYITGNYSAEVGFIPRNNYIKIQATVGHLTYTKKNTSLLSHGPSIERTYYFDTDFSKKDIFNKNKVQPANKETFTNCRCLR